MEQRQLVSRITGVVQHYNWGGFSFIPQLLQTHNEAQKPFAEYWLGAHPNHPAQVTAGDEVMPLNAFLERADGAALGPAKERFGRLPYLLKVLDVRQMLSIQVHPDKQSAEAGFAAENRLGVAVTAPNRNYKDDNHKPELMVALSDFWLLHGFKPEHRLREVLLSTPELAFLAGLFDADGYEGLYRHVMTLPQEAVNTILQPLIDRILPLYKDGHLGKAQEDFWAARAAETYCTKDRIDRGIFSIYLFNLVHLRKGQGVFQGAQMPHAYLEGQNVELMANSDNVLRAGLTDKYIDVPELLRHVRYEATHLNVMGTTDEQAPAVAFEVPVPEFALYQYRLHGSEQLLGAVNAEVLLVLDGVARVGAGDTALQLEKGQAALVAAGTRYTLAGGPDAEVFRAAVGRN